MKTSKLSAAVKTAIVLVSLCGLSICAFWYPFSISLSTMGVVAATPTLAQNVQMWTQLSFYWCTSLPCFFILIIFWKISNAINRNAVFSLQVSKLLKKCAVILFVDIALFVVGNIIFTILQWNDFAILYFIVATLGLVVASILSVLSHYAKKAADLQEETEGLI